MTEKRSALSSRLKHSFSGGSRAKSSAVPAETAQSPPQVVQLARQTTSATARSGTASDRFESSSRANINTSDTTLNCGDECVLKFTYQRHRDAAVDKSATSSEPFEGQAAAEAAPHPDIYQSLRPWQTRLIELYAGSGDQKLRCLLHRVEFIHMPGVGLTGTDRIVSYEALSYSWGSSRETTDIECNGLSFPISQGLAVALRHLRPEQGSRFLWVDAICINQRDNAEKAIQVKNILQIFEKAEKVVAWVGEAVEKNIYLAFDAMDASRDLSPGPQSPLFTRSHGPLCFMGLEQAQYGFRALCKKPWFRRTWVRQEVFAAVELEIICGLRTIPYHVLNTWAPIWLAMKSVRADPLSYSVNISPNPTNATPLTFNILAEHFQHAGTDRADYEPPTTRYGHAGHWFRTFQSGTNFDVTDSLDRVYGVLGMLQSRTTRSYVAKRDYNIDDTFPVNYTQSVSRVFQDIIKFLINTDKTLDALIFFEDRKFLSSSFPSWTPDWRIWKNRDFIEYPKHSLPRTEADFPLEQDHNDEGKLHLRGYILVSQFSGLSTSQYRPSNPRGLVTDVYSLPDSTQLHAETDATRLVQSRNYIKADLAVSSHQEGRRVPGVTFWVPRSTTVDDSIVYLIGAECFFVLRQLTDGLWQFVGPVIVHLNRPPGFWDLLDKEFSDCVKPELEKLFVIV